MRERMDRDERIWTRERMDERRMDESERIACVCRIPSDALHLG